MDREAQGRDRVRSRVEKSTLGVKQQGRQEREREASATLRTLDFIFKATKGLLLTD